MTADEAYHLLLNEGLECVDFAIMFSLHQSHFTECSFTNDLQSVVVLWLFAGAQESQKVGFRFAH